MHRGLSPKQRELAAYGTRPERWTLVSGPVGSGKSHAGEIGFLLTQSRFGNAEFGVLTKGRLQLASVIVGGLERLLDEELRIASDGHFLLPGAGGTTNKVWCFVGNDKRAEPRLRSFNLSGMLIDEMTTLPFSMIAAANARCRVGDAKLLGMTNPDGPRHPCKLQYFDKPDKMNACTFQFELSDNPTITAAYVDSLKALYSGHMLERMVYGRWSAASGLVYPHAIDNSYGEPTEPFVLYDVVIDVGESSVTHALLSGRTASGITWIIDECRHDHLLEGVLTEREMIAKIRRQFAGYDIYSWIVDPAAKRFRIETMSQLGTHARVGKAENDWQEGFEEVNYWLAAGALKLWGDRVPYLMGEIGALVWDEEQAAAGKDVPVQTPDYGTDCMRYLVFTRAVHESGGREAWNIARKRRLEIVRNT